MAKKEPTKLVPAGSADRPVDATADSELHGTTNTHPQSPEATGDLEASDEFKIFTAYNKPGAVVDNIANEFDVTPARVLEIVDAQNAKRVK
jgi:hypothetical protein